MIRPRNDLSRRPLPFVALWGLPIALMLLLNFVHPGRRIAAIVLGACLAWMGFGCALNAIRCRRLHCYLASPVLLIGAALTWLVGFDVLNLGTDGLIYTTWGTLIVVLLTFVPERVFGKYRGRGEA